MAARSRSQTKSGKGLVIVESPAKAKTIERFLGKDYVVQASIGHVRDLPDSATDLKEEDRRYWQDAYGVKVEEGFEPIYVVSPDKKDQIRTLKRILKESSALWLATDEDREGEAISWHLLEVLKPKVPVHRLVFHEITKEAIGHALENPREIDLNLVEAQETRRILDRLYGYELSPLLWRKIPRAKSAGRVQSVALRLLVERERERMRFRRATWWDLEGIFAAENGRRDQFEAQLVEVGGKRIATGRDFDPTTGRPAEGKQKEIVVLDEDGAHELRKRLAPKPAVVESIEEKPGRQKPAAPFTTSTLQQEAGRKLGMSARQAMRVAQSLYQNGVITYMRTDSTALSKEAIEGARSFIRQNYGAAYLPDAPRHYKNKVKNAQEAHEAIRPAGSSFQPVDAVRREHGAEAARLYELIWMRTVASQMPDARFLRMTVHVRIDDARFRASGKKIEFPGFQRAYVEGSDDPHAELAERERLLPALAEGERVHTHALEPQPHHTESPARYRDASLVKQLEEKGIGRPSTWASIIGVLLDRGYAFRRGGALVPTFKGFAVVQMLRSNFQDLVSYEFTARMEDDLDAVARGEGEGKDYLSRFYLGNGRDGLKHLVAAGLEEVDPRVVCRIPIGEHEGREIDVRVGRYGLFVTDGEQNASLPEDLVPDEFTVAQAVELLEQAAQGPQSLGDDPATGKPVYVKVGRYGPYVQLGDVEDDGPKPKMQSLLPGMAPETITFETALRLLELPRDLGPHPEDEEEKSVLALTGRYGPFVKWGTESRSIPEDVSVLDITLAQAVEVLKQPRRRGRGSTPTALKEIGNHPGTEKPIRLMKGRYGPYVTDGEINASVPRGQETETVTLDQAVELLARRAERIKAGGGKKKRTSKKKPAAKKKTTTPKKKAAGKKKKATAKKKKAAPRKKPAS